MAAALIEASIDGGLPNQFTRPNSVAIVEEISRSKSIDHILPRIIRHSRSCEFTSSSSPCIQRATLCLSQLQDRLEEWRRDLIVSITNRRAQQNLLSVDMRSSLKESKKNKLEVIRSGVKLEVIGESALEIPTNNLSIVPFTKDCIIDKVTEIPSELEIIFQSVFHLFGRLETDRVNTAHMLEKEKQRILMLHEVIDKHAYTRMEQLPAAVQKEHEKCAYDLQELKWHCAYRSRTQERLEQRVQQSENINKRIKDDIEFVKDNKPLIENKLVCEKNAMLVIHREQDLTDTELRIAIDEMRTAEKNFETAERAANQELKNLKYDQGCIARELGDISEALESLEYEKGVLDKDLELVESKLVVAGEENETLGEKVEIAKDLEKTSLECVDDVTQRIFEQVADKQRLEKQNDRLRSDKKIREETLTAENSKLQNGIKKKTGRLKKLIYSNRASEKEMNDLKKKIYNYEKQQSSDAKAVKRAIAEREKIEGDLQIISEETDNIRSIHDKLMLSLEQQRINALDTEDRLNMQQSSLQKQLKDESHARMVLQARIANDTTEFMKKRKTLELKRGKMMKQQRDVEKTLEKVIGQVEILQKLHSERSGSKNGLGKLQSQVSAKHSGMEGDLKAQIDGLLPTEAKLKSDLAHICSKQDEKDNTSAGFRKKMEDMAASTVMMKKVLVATDNSINVLNEEINELQIQLDSGQGLEDMLRKTLLEVDGRSKDGSYLHDQQFAHRSLILSEMREKLENCLNLNKDLASMYIKLQQSHINTKHDFIRCYEKFVLANDALKDAQDIYDLHMRLHKAMESYYNLRGLQTRAGLVRFEQMYSSSSEKLNRIQKELRQRLDIIADFLNMSTVDFTGRESIVKIDQSVFTISSPQMVNNPSKVSSFRTKRFSPVKSKSSLKKSQAIEVA